jgi:hypothetical protein
VQRAAELRMLLSADTLEILEDLARCGIAVHQFT